MRSVFKRILLLNHLLFHLFVRETNLTNVPVLFVERFSLDSGKMDFPIHIATIRMGLSIICFKGSQVDFPNKYVLQSLKIAFISIQRVYSPLSDEFNQYMPLGPKVAHPMGQMFRLI